MGSRSRPRPRRPTTGDGVGPASAPHINGMLNIVEPNELEHLDLPRETVALADSAASWLDDALKSWAAGDYAKVGVQAPMAVEHLGKAVLWHKNHVLLSQHAEREEERRVGHTCVSKCRS